jgi:hypothetical protein
MAASRTESGQARNYSGSSVARSIAQDMPDSAGNVSHAPIKANGIMAAGRRQ